MPWHVESGNAECAGWAVVKDDDGSIAGCHDTEAEAAAQVAALYAQEPEASALEVDEEGNALIYGVLLVEGVETGDTPRREFAPGVTSWAATPLPLKFQPAEGPGHDGSMISARMDHIWRDGALIRFSGVMDSAGAVGAEAQRLMAGGFLRGVSILADDIEETDVELVYSDPMLLADDELDDDPNILPGDDEVELHGRHNQKDHGRPKTIRRDIRPKGAKWGLDSGSGLEAMALPMMAGPRKEIYHAGRIRSATLVAEPAFVEATVSLGRSPFVPPDVPGEVAVETVEIMESTPPPGPTVVTAAAYTITIPEVWPESWFAEPTELPPFGALHITAAGRVYGLVAPANVEHRGFRGSRQRVTAPRGIDYSEFQNKAALVAGADGGIYRINAGTITFGCGHASPVDPRRADPNWASEHYENSCSVAARVRVGENQHGTWVAGALLHGIDADTVERMMACSLSGDWQGGKFKAALLVPVEGFPRATTASVRIREDAMVASSVPFVFDEPEPEPDFGWVFDLVASANGRDPDTQFREIAAARFDEIAATR